jgi:hypothetical protein
LKAPSDGKSNYVRACKCLVRETTISKVKLGVSSIDRDEATDDCKDGCRGEQCIKPLGTGEVLCNSGNGECCPTTCPTVIPFV